MRLLFLAAAGCVIAASAFCQSNSQAPTLDADRDGLANAQENALLSRFEPQFQINAHDCSVRPAQFEPGLAIPKVITDNGTIYAQATPVTENRVELHYYHLWRSDCGEMGHLLDAEHVSALVSRGADGEWKALYWYAAAHENTVCDASQIARASTLNAEDAGPEIWISYGKHAAYLDKKLCSRGCGGDSCSDEIPLHSAALINLGEIGAPMNGALWVKSSQWPLEEKLSRSDFPPERTARIDQLPASDVAWANPDLRPVQAVLLGGNDALGGGATGFRATNTALVIANTHTSNALRKATANTGRALGKSYRGVLHFLNPEPSAPADSVVQPQ
ncbi:MAG TPA: hypothetical protein VG844_17380 [Terracidiphilus sp.]|nr:hypothetical protein [Terracidiphilus sp.]